MGKPTDRGTGNLLQLRLVEKKQANDADEVLSGAIGRFSDVMLIGWNNNGELEVWANGELLEEAQQVYMMQLWQTHLMNSALGG